jgi:hypothetical protein
VRLRGLQVLVDLSAERDPLACGVEEKKTPEMSADVVGRQKER